MGHEETELPVSGRLIRGPGRLSPDLLTLSLCDRSLQCCHKALLRPKGRCGIGQPQPAAAQQDNGCRRRSRCCCGATPSKMPSSPRGGCGRPGGAPGPRGAPGRSSNTPRSRSDTLLFLPLRARRVLEEHLILTLFLPLRAQPSPGISGPEAPPERHRSPRQPTAGRQPGRAEPAAAPLAFSAAASEAEPPLHLTRPPLQVLNRHRTFPPAAPVALRVAYRAKSKARMVQD